MGASSSSSSSSPSLGRHVALEGEPPPGDRGGTGAMTPLDESPSNAPFHRHPCDGIGTPSDECPVPGGGDNDDEAVLVEDGHQPHRSPISRSTWLFCLCAAVNSCNLGYDIGVSTGAGRLVQDAFQLSTVQREVFLGSVNFWSIFGALGAHYVSDRYGRRRTFFVAAWGFLLGVALLALATNYATLLAGRFWVGLGVGVGLAVDPLYISEVSPSEHRGELVTYSEIALNVGLLMGFSTGLTLSGLPPDLEWRVMFALGGLLPLAMLGLVATVLPESPRWLVAQGRDDEALAVLWRIHPPGTDAEAVAASIRAELELEKAAECATGWKALLVRPTPAIRRTLAVGVGAAVAQQAVGIDAIQYYLLDVLAQSGIDSEAKQNWVLIGLGIVKLGFIWVGGKLFDRKGRRPLLIFSLLGTAASTFVIGTAFLASKPGTAFVVAGLAFYLAFFSAGIGPGAWLIPSEVFATTVRAKAMSVATFSNRITATLMASTFLSTAHAVGWGGFFLLLSAVSLLSAGAAYVFLPETTGKSLEDMTLYFAKIAGDLSVLEAEERLHGGRPASLELAAPPSRTNAPPPRFHSHAPDAGVV